MPDKTSQTLLKEYLDAYSKEQNQQTEEEKHSILILQQYTRQLKRELLWNEKAMFDGCQFLFCVPFGWTCSKYEDALRALFMETEWITQNDPKNRLIFSPFIESVCQNLIALNRANLEREKKYLYLYLDKPAIYLLSFQMQSTKELIAVSKKLAASDFFLIPTDLGDAVSIYTAELEVLTLYEISITDKSKPLHTSLYGPEEFKEILRGLTCGAFMHELLTDANTKGVIDQLLCEVKGLYSKYSKFQSSPDGIQDVILHCNPRTSRICTIMFRSALLDANFIDPENEFICIRRHEICYGAMQKPLKMIQIANALLPPIVWNEGTSRQVELMDYSNQKEDLLPPNSFYVQAYVNDGSIHFILNKVVVVSLVNGAMQKSTFTVQEASVKLESTFDSVCDNMWNHLMSLECLTDIDQHGHCDTHLRGEYSTSDYHFFKCSIKRMTEELLHGNFAKRNQDIDISHAIPISKKCNCSFQISFRTLINFGLQPVISHIATIIASSLASSSFFGLYTVYALIIMDESKEREAVVACQSLGSWCAGLQQVFGKGTYSQVSSTEYIIRFSCYGTDYNEEGFGLYKYHSDSLRESELIAAQNEFIILEKGHALDSRGSTHVFYQKDRTLTDLYFDIFTINRHKDKVYYYRVWNDMFQYANMIHPFAIRVTPQHHSSTIEFEVSHLRNYETGWLDHKSFSIQEKLSLM
ncbi:hypothetical protein MAM1_0007c00833 [Mucor ambiguus]|uniref:Uncharacterized protein n=1 Tax=Mucor ambiguus TaxID=91626 RepID=A0A0C9LQC7_9FUNG|nr:hypothetical protein MAM1_0007c00833 [Mucor ambiguus]